MLGSLFLNEHESAEGDGENGHRDRDNSYGVHSSICSFFPGGISPASDSQIRIGSREEQCRLIKTSAFSIKETSSTELNFKS
jgi:hypothetical protein